jgi:hypothetical protein
LRRARQECDSRLRVSERSDQSPPLSKSGDEADAASNFPRTANDALSGRGPTERQETRWTVPAVRLNA